jgi:hypothetical protein
MNARFVSTSGRLAELSQVGLNGAAVQTRLDRERTTLVFECRISRNGHVIESEMFTSSEDAADHGLFVQSRHPDVQFIVRQRTDFVAVDSDEDPFQTVIDLPECSAFARLWRRVITDSENAEERLAELVEEFDGCVEESESGGVYGTVTFESSAVSVTTDLIELVDLSNGFDVVGRIEAADVS